MPDFGSLKKGITEKARQAAGQINQQAGQFPSRGGEQSDEASADQAASGADIAEETGRLRALIEKRRPAPGPVRGRWSIGIGDLLAEHPRMPAALRGLVRQLDRYGGLAINPFRSSALSLAKLGFWLKLQKKTFILRRNPF